MKFLTLLEAISLEQMNYVNKKLGGSDYTPYNRHVPMFVNSIYPVKDSRMVIPFNPPNIQVPVDHMVKHHLARNGWGVGDYINGIGYRDTIDRDGNPKREIKKIGKILQDTGANEIKHNKLTMKHEPQSILKFYNNDPVRNSKSNTNIVISRNKEDIAGMSSGRSWEATSCMRLPFSSSNDPACHDTLDQHKHIKHDLINSSLAVYATRNGDDDIESPIGRVTVKRYESTKKVNGIKHSIYRVGSQEFGNVPHGFTDQVNQIMSNYYPAKVGFEYKLAKGLYKENHQSDTIPPIKTGLHNDLYGIKNYNSRGQLHDYVDENGVKQPAVKYKDGDFIHYKDGVIHNEDGIAQRNSDVNYHYINGELHREGDLPAIDQSNKRREYHVGGVAHRANGKPQHIVNNSYLKQTTFKEYGLEHREGGLPSHHEIDSSGNSEIRYKIRGQFNAIDNKTPSHTIKTSSGNIYKLFHKDNKLHRDNDLPAVIEQNGDLITKKWYQHGDNKRVDESKPHTIMYDKNTKEILEKHWNRSAGGNLPLSIIHSDNDVVKRYPNKTVTKYNDGVVATMKKFDDGDSNFTKSTNGYSSIKHRSTNIEHIKTDDGHYIKSFYGNDNPDFMKFDNNGKLIKSFTLNRNEFREANSINKSPHQNLIDIIDKRNVNDDSRITNNHMRYLDNMFTIDSAPKPIVNHFKNILSQLH